MDYRERKIKSILREAFIKAAYSNSKPSVKITGNPYATLQEQDEENYEFKELNNLVNETYSSIEVELNKSIPMD